MEQKSIYIIEQSIKLFAKKGFSSTSVQEIANACGISKGAFYLHFKSKDALLFDIFNYYYQRIQVRIGEIQQLDADDRTKFKKQLEVTFEELKNHREFIIMQVREQAIPFNENIEKYLTQMRVNSYLFYKRHLENIYKERVGHTVWEISLALQGMFKAYMDLIIIEGADLDLAALSDAMLRRADYIVEGFENHNDQPVITAEIIQQVLPLNVQDQEKNLLIEKLQELANEGDQDVRDTVNVVTEEINRERPRPAVLRGMLSNLENSSRFTEPVQKIKRLYQI
ncbi:TetR/AcrR family transcriptional regulator [Halobacillus karajensis]|uniref:Potential acrAB operon repressor n=1 Tax=Halobacillus karajensis TaxID=195088 RepID=A0A024P403_9BACI|nr:TetR/AcrR family transcriptional regulator [Halobacillus karajensis]CDQ18703.1 Potential acrAB operon repressor [Halobacillus karajensis]CDQ23225.1 Potential acrAB operon repressor [Halobacillus karajensis]CDQ26707.1 Potential acrAB operon repressor [Halobacillus karajensis]